MTTNTKNARVHILDSESEIINRFVGHTVRVQLFECLLKVELADRIRRGASPRSYTKVWFNLSDDENAVNGGRIDISEAHHTGVERPLLDHYQGMLRRLRELRAEGNAGMYSGELGDRAEACYLAALAIIS